MRVAEVRRADFRKIHDPDHLTELFDYIIANRIRPYFTDDVLPEYSRVFDYEHLRRYDRRRIARFRGLLQRAGRRVKAGGRLEISGHEDDHRIYECAVAAKASYIVTASFQLTPQGHENRQRPTTPQAAGIQLNAGTGIAEVIGKDGAVRRSEFRLFVMDRFPIFGMNTQVISSAQFSCKYQIHA